MDAAEFMLRLNAQVIGAAGFNGALSSMEAQIKKERASLGDLEDKLASARKKLDFIQSGGRSGKQVDLFSMEKQKDAIAFLEKKIGQKKSAIGDLFKDGAKQAEALIGKKAALKDVMGGKLGSLASAATEAGGPIGALSSKLQSFASIAGKGGAAGAVLVLVAAIFAMVGAAVAGAVAITRFAIECADAARSMRLLGNAAAGGAVAGDGLAMVVDDIASKVPLAKAKIAELGRALEVAHVSGRRMQVTLEAVAALESVGLGGGKISALAEEWSKLGGRAVLTRMQLEGTGITIDEVATALAEKMGGSVASAKASLASGTVAVTKALTAINDAVQKKFGKTIAAQMASLGVQFSKMKENISGLFEGVDLEKFLNALKTITDLFSQNNVIGYNLKKLFSTMFTGIADTLAKFAPYFKAFLIGIAIVAVYAYIGIMKVKKAISEAFGGVSVGSILTVERAMKAGMIAAILIGGSFIAAAAAVGVLVAAVASLAFILALPFLIAIGVIALFIYAIYRVYDAIKEIDLGKAASNLVKSFVDAIKAGVSTVIDAMTSLGKAAETALLEALGIHSPSRIAIDAAQNVTGTFSSEIEDGKGETRAAFSGMVDAGDRSTTNNRSSMRSISFTNCTFGGDLDEGKLRRWWLRILEETAGESPEPEPA